MENPGGLVDWPAIATPEDLSSLLMLLKSWRHLSLRALTLQSKVVFPP